MWSILADIVFLTNHNFLIMLDHTLRNLTPYQILLHDFPASCTNSFSKFLVGGQFIKSIIDLILMCWINENNIFPIFKRDAMVNSLVTMSHYGQPHDHGFLCS